MSDIESVRKAAEEAIRIRERRLDEIEGILDSITDDERVSLFHRYCTHCGGPAGCQCWNDE